MKPSYRSNYIPLEEVSGNDIEDHRKWTCLNKQLPMEIHSYIQNRNSARQNCFASNISLERFKSAVGFTSHETRLGLCFNDLAQQNDFASEFFNEMLESCYSCFSLVATGSSFQGLSTNPQHFRKLRYMKICGDNSRTDLDLQIYCEKMACEALDKGSGLFPNHFEILKEDDKEYARLTTFDNKIPSEAAAPHKFLPWLSEFESTWQKKLGRNFQGTGIVFEGVAVALMTAPSFAQRRELGSPYMLCSSA